MYWMGIADHSARDAQVLAHDALALRGELIDGEEILSGDCVDETIR